MTELLSPRISVSRTRAAYIGPGLDLAPHRNAAATVAIALEQPFALRLPSDGDAPWRPTDFAIIPPGALHHLVASGPMMFIYLDALSDDHATLRRAGLARADRPSLEPVIRWPERQTVESACEAIGIPRRLGDRRLAHVVRAIDLNPEAFVRIEDAAELASLSTSRFRHVFRAEVGMPFRRYRLWRRMACVVRCLSEGSSLTDAALSAGFSSSAHLSSAFKGDVRIGAVVADRDRNPLRAP